ncbi:hypothetical protein BG000_006099, partial [Podila horticola]
MTNPIQPSDINPSVHAIKSVDGVQDVLESHKPDHKHSDDHHHSNDHKHDHHHDYKKEHENKHHAAGDHKTDPFYAEELIAGNT